MRTSTVCLTLSLSLAVAVAPTATAQLPAGWRVVPDAPAPDSLGTYVQMPPGWHLTAKGPGAAIYDPGWTTGPRYTLEWEAFVFPSTAREPFGLFFAGTGLDGDAPDYFAAQLTAQGELGLIHRAGREIHVIVPAALNGAAARPGPEEPARNVIRVSVEPDSIRVSLNGTPAFAVGTPGDLSGVFGFRVGTGTNLHVARFDRTTPLAPPRAPRRSAE